jgi:hypothetical protein
LDYSVIKDVAAIGVAACGCLVAHLAGMKYLARKRAGLSLYPAIVMTVESALMVLGSMYLVHISWS